MFAQGLFKAVATISRCGYRQLVNYGHNRTLLSFRLYHKCLDRQIVRAPSGNLSDVPFYAVFRVSEAEQISA
jgi:hypothetical protein